VNEGFISSKKRARKMTSLWNWFVSRSPPCFISAHTCVGACYCGGGPAGTAWRSLRCTTVDIVMWAPCTVLVLLPAHQKHGVFVRYVYFWSRRLMEQLRAHWCLRERNIPAFSFTFYVVVCLNYVGACLLSLDCIAFSTLELKPIFSSRDRFRYSWSTLRKNLLTF